jgi:glucokinase
VRTDIGKERTEREENSRRKDPSPGIGVDLGGHKIAAGRVEPDSEGMPRIVRSVLIPTPEGRRIDDVVGALAESVGELLVSVPTSASRCPFVGVAVPGFLDPDRRFLRRSPNFPGWDHLPLRDLLVRRMEEQGLFAEVRLENDANCYALGEASAGSARGLTDFVLFTLGTGIGGGIVLGGRLLTGSRGMAGELGHSVVAGELPCGCGGIGHVEALAAADGIERAARAAGLPGDAALLWGNPSPAAEVLRARVIDTLGRAVASVTTILDPQAVILGGGMSRAEGLIEAVRDSARRYLPLPFREGLDLRRAELGPEAAILGAAAIRP